MRGARRCYSSARDIRIRVRLLRQPFFTGGPFFPAGRRKGVRMQYFKNLLALCSQLSWPTKRNLGGLSRRSGSPLLGRDSLSQSLEPGVAGCQSAGGGWRVRCSPHTPSLSTWPRFFHVRCSLGPRRYHYLRRYTRSRIVKTSPGGAARPPSPGRCIMAGWVLPYTFKGSRLPDKIRGSGSGTHFSALVNQSPNRHRDPSRVRPAAAREAA